MSTPTPRHLAIIKARNEQDRRARRLAGHADTEHQGIVQGDCQTCIDLAAACGVRLSKSR